MIFKKYIKKQERKNFEKLFLVGMNVQ